MNAIRRCIAATLMLALVSAPALAAESSSERVASPGNIIFNHAPGADDAGAPSPAVSYHYQFIAAPAFTKRSGTVEYAAPGCTRSSDYVITNVQLPDGATVEGIRGYYYDNGDAGKVNFAFTTYDGAGNYTDVEIGTSTLEAGYSSEYFPLPAAFVIDNSSLSYNILGRAFTGTNLEFCGIRIFYSMP